MSAGTALAIYDFDGTLIAGDSIVAYLRFARFRGGTDRNMSFLVFTKGRFCDIIFSCKNYFSFRIVRV